MSRSSRSLPCPQAHLPLRALATLRHHWCQDKVKTPQGQFQATELSFNHVSSTNVRKNYMAKSLQAVLDMWKLILQLLLGQRNRTTRWQRQQQRLAGQREISSWKKHIRLHYPPQRMTMLLAQDTLLSPLVQRSQRFAHTPALLLSREGWGCRTAVRILYTSSFLPLKHLGSSVPGQVTASTNSLWLSELITSDRSITISLSAHSRTDTASLPPEAPQVAPLAGECLRYLVPGAVGTAPFRNALADTGRHSTGTQDVKQDMPGHLTINSVLISLTGNRSRAGVVVLALFSLFLSNKV